jgi:hypothetical protein
MQGSRSWIFVNAAGLGWSVVGELRGGAAYFGVESGMVSVDCNNDSLAERGSDRV